MKAILDQDIIVSVSSTGSGVDIGALPAGVGLERLRWGGEVVVDLADLSAIYVDGRFGLHCVSVAGSQLVTMTYADRKNLIMDGVTIRVKTAAELDKERKDFLNKILKTKLRSNLTAQIGDSCDQMADFYKLMMLVIESVLGNTDALAALATIGSDLKITYDYDTAKIKVLDNIVVLKTIMPEYYETVVTDTILVEK